MAFHQTAQDNGRIYQKNIIASLIIVLIATASSLMMFSPNIYFAVAFFGLVLSVFAFVNIKAAVWIILINVFLTSSMIGNYFPFIGRKAIWLTDLMLFIMLIRLLVFFVMEKTSLFNDKDNLLIFFLVLLGAMSALLNGTSGTVAICGFRNYFKYIPLFFALKYLIDDREFIKKAFWFWVVVAAINVPLSVYQLIAGETIDTMSRYDLVGGLFSTGGSGILSVFQLVIIGFVLLMQKNSNILSKGSVALFTLFLLLPLFINETKITFILLPIMFLYVYKDRVRKKPLEAFGILIVMALLLFSLNKAYDRPDQNFGAQSGDKSMFSKGWLNSYLYDSSYFVEDESLNRFSALEFAIGNIVKDPVRFFMGVGPGNASYSQLQGGMGEYYLKYFDLHIDMIFLSKILWEYGFLGTFAYFLLIIYLWRKAVAVKMQTNDGNISSAVDAYIVLTGFLAITLIYNLSFYIDELGCMFWCISGFFRNRQIA